MKIKNIIICSIVTIFVLCLCNSCKDAKIEEPKLPDDFYKKYIPLYEIEFARQLGIDTSKLKNPIYSHMEIGELCNQIGSEKVLAIAKQSKDPFTHHHYFLVSETPKGFAIQKMYPLDTYYIIVTLSLIRKDKILETIGLSYTIVQRHEP